MNAPPPDTDPPPEELSAAEDAQVRRLLADARVDGPMPPEVAERMEATLAELARDEYERHPGVPPAERPARPFLALSSRRRRVLGGLAAAAVLVVVGVGIGQLINTSHPPDVATSESADRSVPGDSDAGAPADEAEEPGAAAPTQRREPGPDLGHAVEVRRVDAPVPVVRPERLADDALRVRRTLVPHDGRRDAFYRQTLLLSPVGFKCAETSWGLGVLVGVEYDDHPALLAFREPTGEQQIAEVLQCGTGDLLRSTTIPAPR